MRPAHAVLQFNHVTAAAVNRRRSDVIEQIIRDSVEANIIEPSGVAISKEKSTFSLEFIPTTGVNEALEWIAAVEKVIGIDPLTYLDISFEPYLKVVADAPITISQIDEEASCIQVAGASLNVTGGSSRVFFGIDAGEKKRFTGLRTIISCKHNLIELNSVDDLVPGSAIAYFVTTAGVPGGKPMNRPPTP